MAKELSLEEALAKNEALEAEKKKLTADNISLAAESTQLRKEKRVLEETVKNIEETSMAAITELQEKLADTEAQKAGGLPIRKISDGEHAGSYQFTAASFNLKGSVIKAGEVKNDSDVLRLLVSKKSGVIEKINSKAK